MSRPICPRCHTQGGHDEGCVQPALYDVETLMERMDALETQIEELEKAVTVLEEMVF